MPVSLKQQYLFLTVLETGNFKIKALVWGLVESTLPTLQTTGFSLCPHMAERDRETKEVSSLLSLFMRAPIPFMRAPFPGPNYLPKAPPPAIPLGIQFFKI